jgi:hypothetical protein
VGKFWQQWYQNSGGKKIVIKNVDIYYFSCHFKDFFYPFSNPSPATTGIKQNYSKSDNKFTDTFSPLI